MSNRHTDADLKAVSLNMWANHIETGNVALAATDIMERLSSARSAADELALRKQLRPLDAAQRALVERLRSLAGAEQGTHRPSAILQSDASRQPPTPSRSGFIGSWRDRVDADHSGDGAEGVALSASRPTTGERGG